MNRGGARNYADRLSSALTDEQCRAIMETIVLASNRGQPLNRFHTIHWQKYMDYNLQNNLTPLTAMQYQTAFFNSARDWSNKALHALGHSERIAYLWVRENDDGDKSKGDHVHILWHIPQPIMEQFIRYTRRWIKAATHSSYIAKSSKYVCIGRKAHDYLSNEPLYCKNLESIQNYMLKGANKEAARALGLPQNGAGGIVKGKRWGRSQNLR